MIHEYLDRVQRGIDFIEQNLEQAVSFDDVARAAGLSGWHFQRIFKAITHETLKSYIRSRRLSHACTRLVDSRQRILDIALLAGFDSQESFTRAFKSQTGLTPGGFRRAGTLRTEHRKVSINTAYLSHLRDGVALEPEFRSLPGRTYIGLSTVFYGECSDKNDMARHVPPLWDAFLPRLGEIADTVPGMCYGIVDQDRDDGERLSYCAAIEVMSPTAMLQSRLGTMPSGMVGRSIAPQTYAVFRHIGAIAGLDNTVNYIYSNWLLNTGWRHAQTPDLEMYGDEYDPLSASCVTYYAVPVIR